MGEPACEAGSVDPAEVVSPSAQQESRTAAACGQQGGLGAWILQALPNFASYGDTPSKHDSDHSCPETRDELQTA